ncbi:MAG: hypothetical protein K6G18_01345 [Treponema sp.]|nr:hypothetical protein [Treponema sp.]
MKRNNLFSTFTRRMTAPVRKSLSLAIRIAGCAVLGACIVVSLYLALAVARVTPRLAVLFSSAATGGFSFALAIVSLPLLRKLIRADERELQRQIREQEAELDRLRREKEGFEEREVDFQRRIALLENLTLNMETYRDVFKVCFRDYRQEATIKQRESFNEEEEDSGWNKMLGRKGKSYDEILSIMDCTVSYQRGVDLQKVKIAKVNNNTVVVSGLSGEYLTMPRFDYRDFFSEIRHVRLDKNGDIRRISVEDGEYYGKELRRRQGEYKAQFEDSFLNGKDSDDSEEITKRAEDFIRIILQPIYAHVEFDNSIPVSESQPLLDFLRGEMGLYRALQERQSAKAEPQVLLEKPRDQLEPQVQLEPLVQQEQQAPSAFGVDQDGGAGAAGQAASVDGNGL